MDRVKTVVRSTLKEVCELQCLGMSYAGGTEMGDGAGTHSAGPTPGPCFFTTFPPVWCLSFLRSMSKYMDKKKTHHSRNAKYIFQEGSIVNPYLGK